MIFYTFLFLRTTLENALQPLRTVDDGGVDFHIQERSHDRSAVGRGEGAQLGRDADCGGAATQCVGALAPECELLGARHFLKAGAQALCPLALHLDTVKRLLHTEPPGSGRKCRSRRSRAVRLLHYTARSCRGGRCA